MPRRLSRRQRPRRPGPLESGKPRETSLIRRQSTSSATPVPHLTPRQNVIPNGLHPRQNGTYSHVPAVARGLWEECVALLSTAKLSLILLDRSTCLAGSVSGAVSVADEQRTGFCDYVSDRRVDAPMGLDPSSRRFAGLTCFDLGTLLREGDLAASPLLGQPLLPPRRLVVLLLYLVRDAAARGYGNSVIGRPGPDHLGITFGLGRTRRSRGFRPAATIRWPIVGHRTRRVPIAVQCSGERGPVPLRQVDFAPVPVPSEAYGLRALGPF
jgi:hypothetical protein